MLKPQDIVVLLKLVASTEHLDWSQHELATQLCLSVSVINASLSRLKKSGLIHMGLNDLRYQLVGPYCEELIISGVKYFFPAKIGDNTRGIPTCYAAPIMQKYISQGQDSDPVWPCAEGNVKGRSFEPLYHSVPKSLIKFPDSNFYDLLVLVDVLRNGRAREKNIAIKLLKERIG